MSVCQLWDSEYGYYVFVSFSNFKVPLTSTTSIQAISDNPMAANITEEAEVY